MRTIKAWAVVNRTGLLRTAEIIDGRSLRLPHCIYRHKREALSAAVNESQAAVVRVEIREVTR